MAEKLKDAEDRLLEAMLRSEPIADEGFSGRVVSRIRRRLWVQRLALPSAMLIGGAIAVKLESTGAERCIWRNADANGCSWSNGACCRRARHAYAHRINSRF
jgi:hypothetical protein